MNVAEGTALASEDSRTAFVLDLESAHGQSLFGFARRLGLTDEQAADAVQETLMRYWRALGRDDPLLEPAAWAFRTLYRLCMDEHRRRRRFSALLGRLHGGVSWERSVNPSGQLADRIAVWTEVDRLPPRQREVVYLRYRADLPFENIGHILGITPGAARSHASAAVASLRNRLGANDG